MSSSPPTKQQRLEAQSSSMVAAALVSYPCQVAVLKYMEANKRILFSVQCPEIRSTDRSVALKINTLHLIPFELHLNGMIYEIDYIQRNHLTKTTQPASNVIEWSTFPIATHLTPHSLVYPLASKTSVVMDKVQFLESRLRRFWKNERFEFEEGMSEEEVVEEYEPLLEKLLELDTARERIRPLGYSYYLRFEKSAPEYLELTQPAYMAMDYVIRKIFEGRKEVHITDMSVVIPEEFQEKLKRKTQFFTIPSTPKMILKALPMGLKVEQLRLPANYELAREPMLQYSRSLIIPGPHNHERTEMIRHKRVHFTSNIRLFMDIVTEFLEKQDREIGTFWTFDFEEDFYEAVAACYDTYVDAARERMPGVELESRENEETRDTLFPHRIVQRLSDTSEIHFYCSRKINEIGEESWMQVLEVLPIGSRLDF